MNSPRYAPAGLLVESAGARVMIDGGGAAAPSRAIDAWLVTDERCELMPDIRRRARARGLEPVVASLLVQGLAVEPKPVVLTSHPCWGYLIETSTRKVGWAPEFLEFPAWAAGVDLLFAEAAGWQRPIRFAHGAGGHAAVLDVALAAQRLGVRRLIFAHIGRPTLRAIDDGLLPPFGEVGHDGALYELA
ncbi:MAG: hypothetical protein KGJ86_21285 [Chloroflexota bacterium]|nr:hypothetical protein [Chloroflexota bacterium]